MITINIDPILFHLGPLELTWHSIFIVVGIVVAVWLSVRFARQAGLSQDDMMTIAVWSVPGGVVGSRLVHVIDYWSQYMADPLSIFAIWHGGLAVWGAVLGGTLTAAVVCRVKGIPFGAYADQIAPGLVLAQAVGRIGDIINGEHFSTFTNLPWAVVYTHPNSPAFGRPPSHPEVAYELLMNLAIFGLAVWLRNRLRPSGAPFLVYLSVYSVGRFFLSFLRLDSNTVWLGLSQPQWICLAVLVVAVPLLVWMRPRLGPPQLAVASAVPAGDSAGDDS